MLTFVAEIFQNVDRVGFPFFQTDLTVPPCNNVNGDERIWLGVSFGLKKGKQPSINWLTIVFLGEAKNFEMSFWLKARFSDGIHGPPPAPI